jgi:hypothetical protein
LLADTWQPDTACFVNDGLLARAWLRRAVHLLHAREPVAAADRIESVIRSWLGARTNIPRTLCDAVRGVLRDVITEVHRTAPPQSPAALLGAMLVPSTRITHDNERPPPSPHVRI